MQDGIRSGRADDAAGLWGFFRSTPNGRRQHETPTVLSKDILSNPEDCTLSLGVGISERNEILTRSSFPQSW